MTITNGYATLAELKNYLRISSTDTNDDSIIELLVEGASRLIDNETYRTFYARTETHLYDVPEGNTLYLDDDDLIAITTLTNGDGTVLTTTDYILVPNNKTPKWAIELKASSVNWWQYTSAGNYKQAISVVGTWGYSSSAPTDIKECCLRIAEQAYHNRFGENPGGDTTITAGGVVISSTNIPSGAMQIILNYRRP